MAIKDGTSVDVLEIDGASNTGVDNIRELRENVKYMPGEGRYKVYIIDEVHMLSTPAFNALLKTLEEPPPHVVFIFATTEPHRIPATIHSRCQRFDFRRIPLGEIQAHLKRIANEEGITIEDEALYLITREAEGSLRDAQGLLDQVIAFAGSHIRAEDVASSLGVMDRAVLFELIEAMVSGDGKACLNIVEKVYNFGYDLKKVSRDLLEQIRNLTVVKVAGESIVKELPDSELERLRAIAEEVGLERLQAFFSVLSRGYEDIAKGTSPRFSLEMALLRAAHLEEFQPIQDLITRLEGLKRDLLEGRPLREEKEGLASAVKKKVDPSPPSEGTSLSEDVDIKRGLVLQARAHGPFWGRMLESADVRFDGERLDIKVPGDGSMELKEKMELICRAFFKDKRPRISISFTGNFKDDQKEEDPLIKEAVRIFGGKVIEDRRRTNV